MLTPDDLRRYARHLTLPEFGAAGQERLKNGSVLCVGAGGLGAPALMYLAAAGVGRIGLVDADVVDESNLQRQLLYATGDIGRPKVEAAAERIAGLNPLVTLETHRVRFTRENAEALAQGYDVLLDGTDNFAARYLCNDVAFRLRKPNVHGAVQRFEGQLSVFAPHLGGPCYRCLFPEPPPAGSVPSCAEGGILGVMPGLLGILQATETIKLLAGLGEPLVGRLLHVDALTMHFREIKLRRDPACALCGESPTLTELPAYAEAACAPAPPPVVPALTVQEFAALRSSGAPYHVLDVREPEEIAVARLPESQTIPLGQLPQRVAEVPRDRPLVVHCRSGARSARAVDLLQKEGFTDIRNLTGGILAWAAEIDPSLKPN